MLGEQISEGRGKRSARRVLSTAPQVTVETSFEDSSKLLGVDGSNIGTYTATVRPDGTLDGQGEGVFASVDGEIATWKGVGAGKLLAGGAVRYVGALTFSTSSQKLARLNGIAGAFEFDVDGAGNTHTKMWEWK
jgi:hypothetical protein